MSRLDDRLTRELERAARPPGATGVFERVDRRRARRHAVRRIQAAALAVAVIAGSIGGFALLSKSFRQAPTPGGEAPIRNGLLVVSMYDKWGEHLYIVDPTTPQADARGPINLTLGHPEFDSDPAISPDGTTVAFARKSYGDSVTQAVWLVGIDGSDPHPLMNALALSPAWSPDGTRLAFAGSPGGPFGIWVVNADGSDARLVDGTGDLAVGAPSWSPDGSKIVFPGSSIDTRNQPTHWDLYVSPIDGTAPDLTDITNTPATSEVSPAWSPDGSTIVFARGNADLAIDDIPDGGLATIQPDGSDQRALTPTGTFDQHPDWSPDGSTIVFDRLDASLDSSRLTDTSIYTIRPDGSGLDRLAVGSDPAWQPIPPDSTSAPPASPAPSGPASLSEVRTILGPTKIPGVSQPACNVTEVTADFWGGSPTTVFVYQLEPDVGGCSNAVSGSSMVGIAPDGSTVTATYGPLACQPESCHIFGAPDVDGDGRAELAVVESSYGSSDLVQVYTVVANEQPTLVSWRAGGGRLSFDWDPTVETPAGAFCQRSGPYDLALWTAGVNPDGTYDLLEVFYRFDGSDGQLISNREDKHVLPSKIAPGGGDQLCGVTVLP